MTRETKRPVLCKERFYAVGDDDYESVEIERNCVSGQVRLMYAANDRWRMPDELIAHLQWCIDQVRKLPSRDKATKRRSTIRRL